LDKFSSLKICDGISEGPALPVACVAPLVTQLQRGNMGIKNLGLGLQQWVLHLPTTYWTLILLIPAGPA